ncbi:MAG: ribose 5-phosphate isomerase A [Lachnospiraceae bacterium]|nr:ribose 5-phosphate isomerase A [Lachnospiraceae bacterium]
MKKKCAQKAISMIEDGMTIGLGGGQSIAFLIKELEKSEKMILAVTPSQDTLELCLKYRIPVRSLEMTDQIDIAFDGCDELDENLNALKSCGGIHTREKIVAVMAKNYVLLADEQKYHKTLSFHHPITIEVIRSARAAVKKSLKNMGASVIERHADKKVGLVVSDDGNYLMDVRFSNSSSLDEINAKLNRIPGIVEHSLFYQIASKAIIASENGIQIIERKNKSEKI